jgi:hypothetical protein
VELTQFDTRESAERGFEMQLINPRTGEKIEAWITVRGADSNAYRERQRVQQKERIERAARVQRVAVTPEELEESALELLAAATVGWRGINLDGEALGFSFDAAVKLYRRFRWIAELVDRAINDRGNF